MWRRPASGKSSGIGVAQEIGDPGHWQVGARLRHQFPPRVESVVRGDIGGFGLQSTFARQAVGAYSYQAHQEIEWVNPMGNAA